MTPLAAVIQEAHDTNTTALVIFIALFAFVTVLGFVAARWRRAKLDHLDEWGLGGRSFGTVITWFLLGGDLYTAYTFIAVPALVFGVGAAGFFALPYTIIMYPLVFMVLPRLWTVCRAHGYVTPADFVRGRYGSPPLALVVALHRPAGDDAVHRAAARRHAGRARRARRRGRLAADHRLRDPRRLHVPVGPARAGAHRDRQGPAHLRDDPRRGDLHPVEDRRLRRDVRRGREGAADAHAQAGRADPGRRQRAGRLRDARARLGARAVSLPARGHRRAERQERADGPPQHRAAARLHVPARPHRAARLHGDRARDQAEQPELRRARPVPQRLPVVVRRHRVRGDRDRCARARGGHVDRGGQPLHALDLQGVPAQGRLARRRGADRRRSSRWA